MISRKVDVDKLVELVRLHRMGEHAHEVARLLGISPNTERKYRTAFVVRGILEGSAGDLPSAEFLKAIIDEELPVQAGPQQRSTIEDWEEIVAGKVAKGVGAKAIHDYLCQEEKGFKGSYSAVKRLVARLEKARGVAPDDVSIPVQTDAGEIAQVDFGYVGLLYDPKSERPRKAWVFVMVLAYSRHIFARVVFDQRAVTWLQLHVEAFQRIGGVPKTLVPDNLKAAVIRAAFGIDTDSELNRSYRELARFYGFKIDPCPPRAPKKKGKVEAGVKYVKKNFFAAWEPTDIDEANRKLDQWVEQVAGQRDHGTTRRRPLVVFQEEEKACLIPLLGTAYVPVVWKKALVHKDCHLLFEGRLWSVPWRFVGKEVLIRATPDALSIYVDEHRIAEHDRRQKGARLTRDGHLPDAREAWRHRSRAYWEERAAFLGDEVLSFIQQVFDADDVLLRLRPVIGIVKLLEQHPRERARNACVRASFFGNYTYGGIKEILAKGLDYDPLPEPLFPDDGRLEAPAFARKPNEFETYVQ